MTEQTYQTSLDQAKALSQPVLVSRTTSVQQTVDAASLFRKSSEPVKILWSQNDGRDWVVGLGAAVRFDYNGADRFVKAKTWYREVINHASIEGPARRAGPIAFAGFRFDHESEKGDEWANFHDASLIIPRHLYLQDEDGLWLTQNTIVNPNGQSWEPESIADNGGSPWPLKDAGDARLRWREAVQDILKHIAAGELQKAVMARKFQLTLSSNISVYGALNRLLQDDSQCTVFAFAQDDRCFLGASPELLVRAKGTEVNSICLAGSSARGSMEQEDRVLGENLLNNAKERQEHRLVVEAVKESLSTLCEDLSWNSIPYLMKLKNVQHLATQFNGKARPAIHILEYVESLHPTPAVAGTPREAAMALMRRIEGIDRGWYAGPVGWLDASGGGEFTIAIRSALVQGRKAFLFAGAGIVEGSDPDQEYSETELKFRSLSNALEN